jgi:hypothetical protein
MRPIAHLRPNNKPDPMVQFAVLADCLHKGLHTLAVQSVRPFPIGLWITSDGRQILFSADYQPIWQRHRDGTVAAADPFEWIKGIIRREHFFDDRLPLHLQYDNLKKLRAIVLDWESGQRRQAWQAKMRRLRARRDRI